MSIESSSCSQARNNFWFVNRNLLHEYMEYGMENMQYYANRYYRKSSVIVEVAIWGTCHRTYF